MYNNKFLELIFRIGRAIIPRSIFKFFQPYYHRLMAFVAALYFGFPSRKLIVIGITGTKGKSSSANFIWAGLMSVGVKTGLFSTANIKIGSVDLSNIYHMTMPSPFIVQGKLREMVNNDCEVAILEVTSEGIKQFRHQNINFDIVIFTNLTPEHIASHGTFENYRKAKQTIFKNLSRQKRKIFKGIKIPKIIIANGDSSEFKNFINFDADKKIIFGINNTDADIVASNYDLNLKIPGKFNILNALPAIAIGKALKFDILKIVTGLNNLANIPGRMEVIQNEPFTVIVDYAHEKESLTVLLQYAKSAINKAKIILLIGAEGGGRDKSKRAIMGQIGAKEADYLIVSNVDPYEEDPKSIVNDIGNSAKENGLKVDKNLFLIEDREEGIKKAISLAQDGDFVLITGKGSEQSMIIGKNKIPWDDRKITRSILEKLSEQKND